MKWADYQEKHQELRRQISDLRSRLELDAAYKEEEQLAESTRRLYQLDDNHQASVTCSGSLGPWIRIRRLQEGRVVLYACEFGQLPSKAMLVCAQVQAYIEMYIAGEIDDLPPSDAIEEEK